MQGTRVQPLVQEESTCQEASKPVSHNYRAVCQSSWRPRACSLGSATREAPAVRDLNTATGEQPSLPPWRKPTTAVKTQHSINTHIDVMLLCDQAQEHFTPVVFFPESHNTSLIMRSIRKIRLNYIQQIPDQNSLKCYSHDRQGNDGETGRPAETEKMWWLSTWYLALDYSTWKGH